MGGDTSTLDARDLGFFTVDTPNFWERPEIDGYLRDVRTKPDKYRWLERTQSRFPLSSAATDTDLLEILHSLKPETEPPGKRPLNRPGTLHIFISEIYKYMLSFD